MHYASVIGALNSSVHMTIRCNMKKHILCTASKVMKSKLDNSKASYQRPSNTTHTNLPLLCHPYRLGDQRSQLFPLLFPVNHYGSHADHSKGYLDALNRLQFTKRSPTDVQRCEVPSEMAWNMYERFRTKDRCTLVELCFNKTVPMVLVVKESNMVQTLRHILRIDRMLETPCLNYFHSNALIKCWHKNDEIGTVEDLNRLLLADASSLRIISMGCKKFPTAFVEFATQPHEASTKMEKLIDMGYLPVGMDYIIEPKSKIRLDEVNEQMYRKVHGFITEINGVERIDDIVDKKVFSEKQKQ